MRILCNVGFGRDLEDPAGSGIWKQEVTERPYSGDVISSTKRATPDDVVSSDISLDHRVAIVADPYAIENPNMILYVGWDGALWTVTSVEIRRPRLILSLGGVYNGNTP